MFRLPVSAVLLLLLFSCSRPQKADIIYTNAKIWTGDSAMPWAKSIAIKDSIILYLGDDADAWKGSNTKLVDLNGQLVVPGLMDNHTHFLLGGEQLLSADLRQAKSPQDFIRILGTFCREQPEGTWIKGGFWDNEAWGGELPTRQWIDSVTGNHPLFIYRYDGHMVLANSIALRMAGIDRNTPDPAGGTIIRNPNTGEPTGGLKDAALALVEKIIPPPSPEMLRKFLDTATRYALSHGVTRVTDMGGFGGWADLDTYRNAYANNELPIRILARLPITDWSRLDSFVKAQGRGDDRLSWDGLKGFTDGSLGSTTAWFFRPYLDAPGSTGFMVTDSSQLRNAVVRANAAGLKVNVHAIGDRAIDWIIGVYEQAQAAHPGDHRFSIEHTQHIRLEDIPRLSRAGIIPSMQPYHAIDDGRWAYKRLDSARLKGTYAFRSLLASGASMTFGSDWPVAPSDPIAGIYAAVTRRTLDNRNPEGWFPAEKITVEQALRAYTVHNAYATFQEDRLGMLKKGMLADMVVLSGDLFSIAPEKIREIQVTRTVVNGKEVFVK